MTIAGRVAAMRSRALVCGGASAFALLLGCGNGAATTGSETSDASTGMVDPATTDPATSTPVTGDTTEDASATDASTTDEPTTTGLDSSTGPAPGCGNGVIDGDDVCDGDDLDEVECTTLGFMSGAVGCLADCSGLDTSKCVEYPARCGDGQAQEPEVCDGVDVAGASCITQGFDSGALGCQDDCAAFDTSECGTCGNVIVEGDEACDDLALLGQTCLTQGFDNGQIACAADCMGFDTSGCGVCGDDLAAAAEPCDGADLAGQTCPTQGFDSGTLACNMSCSAFDVAGCGICGNGQTDGDELCDGVALDGASCVSQGFDSGTLACDAGCGAFATAGCGTCGNGSIDGAESCDGLNLDGQSCMSLGLGAGVLACLPSCLYDFTDCDIPGSVTVDFPTAADPRFTLFGTLPWNQGDWFQGVRATIIPSIGQLDIHLEIVTNGLTACGVQEAEVSINGVAVGTFAVVQGSTVIDQSYPIAPAIVGPMYTIRYETTATVQSGCGAAGYDQVGSTVTFHAG
jgi:hypothetical protein